MQKKPVFVDLFKHYRVFSLENCQKQGEVRVVFNEMIQRKVFSLKGDVSLTNFLRFPLKSAPNKNFSLNYFYVFASFPVTSLCSMTFTLFSGTQSLNLVFSSLFKEIRLEKGNILQIPLKIPNNSWTVLVIDAKNYVKEFFQEFSAETLRLANVKLCANLLVKTVIISETLYKIDTLPAEFRLRGMRNTHDFQEKFNYILLSPLINPVAIPNNENKENEVNFAEKPKEFQENCELKPSKRSSFQRRFPSQPKKRVTFFENNSADFADLQPNSKTPCPTPLEMHELSQSMLTEALPFQLTPCPIMNLSHIHGASGTKRIEKIAGSKIAYIIGPNLIFFDIQSKRQKRWVSPFNKENIADFAVVRENLWVLVLTNSKLLIIDCESLTTLAETPLAMKIAGTISYARISNGFRVFLSGNDEKSRNCFYIFDIPAKNPKNLALRHKQLSDFEVQRTVALSAQSLLTLSPRLLRLWTLKTSEKCVLVPKNVALDCEITEKPGVFLTSFAISRENRKLLVSTSSGMLILLSITENSEVFAEGFEEKIATVTSITVDSLYKLADQAIISINLLENRLIATSFADARLVVWREDLSRSVCEGKMDSQGTSLNFLNEDTLVVGTLNGSLGLLSVSQQKFSVLVRTHEENICKLLYNSQKKQLISVSKLDKTVRIWDFHAKSRELVENYEFRCLDYEVSAICLLKNSNLLLCGLENGNLRAFDLNSYAVSWEKTLFSQEPVSVIASDSHEKLLLFANFKKSMISLRIGDEEIANFTCKELNNCGFDELGLYFFSIVSQGFEVEIFSIKTLEKHVSFQTSLQISAISFSSRPKDVFLIDIEGNLSQYYLENRELSLRRVFKDRDFCSWLPSQNTLFAISLHKSGCLKVWDYDMRGASRPDCQIFAAGEGFGEFLVSNDEEKLVFATGERSNAIYVWQFLNDIAGIGERESEERGQFERDYYKVSVFQKKEEPLVEVKEGNVGKNKEMFNSDSRNFEEKKEKVHENQEIAQENRAVFNIIPMNSQEKIELPAREDLNKDNSSSFKKMKVKETVEIDVPLLGKHLFWTSQIGFDTKKLKNSLIWNHLYQFLAYICDMSIIITYFQTPKVQKKLDFPEKILFFQQTTQEKAFVIALESLKIVVFSCETLQNLTNFSINSEKVRESSRLQELDISPCGHYLLSFEQSAAQILIKVWEISTGVQVSCSFIKEMLVSTEKTDEIRGKWSLNPRNLEFCVFSSRDMQLWRLNYRRSLEYQSVSLPKAEESLQKYGEFSCVCFISRNNSEDLREFLLIGSKKGSVYFIDTCSGALLCMLAGVLQGNIREIQADQQRIIAIGSDHLMNFFEFPRKSEKTTKKINEFEQIIEVLEQNPRSLALDSKIASVSRYFSGQCVAISCSGVLWLVDFNEQCTVKLFASHKTGCSIKKLLFNKSFHESQDFFQEKICESSGLLVSVGEDSSVKLWDIEGLEPVCELINTKQCLCCENFEDLGFLVNGYSDGSLGFFDYKAGFHKGYSKIVGNEKENVQFLTLSILQNSKNNFLVTIDRECVYLGYLSMTNDREIHLDLGVLIENLEFPIVQIFINPYEELLEWGFADISGKISVWNRKELSRVIKHVLTNVQGVELYLVDSYRAKSNSNKEKEKENSKNLAKVSCSLKNFPKETSRFLKEKDCYLTLILDGSGLLLRNFRDHVNIRTIDLRVPAFCFILNEKRGFLYTGGQKGCISMYDYKIGLEVDRYEGNGFGNVETLCWVKFCEGKEVLAAGQDNSIMFLSAF